MEMTTEPMPDPLSRFIKDVPEMYELVRTVIVVCHRRLCKVEVLKDQTALARFKVYFSLQERLTVEQIDPESKERFKKVLDRSDVTLDRNRRC
jgi:hypothetical protein